MNLTQYLKDEWRAYLAGGMLLLLTTGAALSIPWTLKQIILSLELDPSTVGPWILLLIGLAVLKGFLRVGSRVTLFDPARRVEYRIRGKLFSHMMRQSRSFFGHHPIGDVMSRATQDLNQVRLLLGPGILGVMNTIFSYVGGLTACLLISWRLTLLAILPYIVLVLLLGRVARMLMVRFRRSMEANADLTAYLQGTISGIALIRAHGEEGPVTGRFDDRNQEIFAANWSLAKVRAILFPLMFVLPSIGAMVTLLVGGRAVVQEEIDLATFVAFAAYLHLLAQPTISMGWIIAIFARARTSWKRLQELFDFEPQIQDRPEVTAPAECRGHLEVKNLSFAYPGDERLALEDIDIDLGPGRILGVVGRVASGKSTLGRLISRLEEPPDGTVLVDGKPVADWPLEALRRQVSVVPQEIFLLTDTLANNLRMGAPDVDDETLLAATQTAEIHDDILTFAKGYDTEVGERGVTLSGGQRQRTAIARALLHGGKILVLDDCLSAVDIHTERRILRHLREARDGITTIVISTRLSAVVEADEIIVMDEGRIVQRGRHDDLLTQAGLYGRLWRREKEDAA
ncbi:MAG: hypothetical protein CMH55_08460 [Myxococcales bacterium]|nr:hypothetical protein [Myxococcales bacterium]